MTIAVHIPSDKINGLLHTAALILAAQHPDDHFIFFSEKDLNLSAGNSTQVIISPKLKNKLLRHYWYNYKLPSLLKRYYADAFISGAGMISLKADIDQYVVFEEEIFASEKSSNSYYKKIFRNALLKAKMIFVAEDIFKANAGAHLPESEKKIKVCYHGFGEKQEQLPYAEQQKIKDEHTEGYDYFLYPVTNASSEYLITILKALSLFKKRQRSSLKLVLLLKQNIGEYELIKDFKNYKYRDDVVFIKDKKDISPGIIRSAYAMIYFCEYAQMNTALKAMYAGIPLIAEATPINDAIFSNMVLSTENNAAALAEQMMLIYKDEEERNRLMATGYSFTYKYDTQAAAEAIWRGVTEK
jgi:glycosyltransferase involved in cell wall biosynthesis